jgi:hypothetical protein
MPMCCCVAGKQCRERWLNHSQPGTRKGNWQLAEEFMLALQHSRYGSHWSRIGRALPGRTENCIKNFWNATGRSKTAARTKTLLWTYINQVCGQEV